MMHVVGVVLTALGMFYTPLVPRGHDHHDLHDGAVSSVEKIEKEVTQ